MNDIIGHDKIQDFFAKVIDNGALSHAYCFVGVEGVGKKALAKNLAFKLLETNNLQTSPDFTVVEQIFDEKTEKTKRDITVTQIRELREFLSRSSCGGYKIAIIDGAEKMNSEAVNALLKTLEEPSKKTILFLVTNDEQKLPETIKSRCQTIYFHPVDTGLIQKYLERLDVEDAEEMSRLSLGLPGKVLTWSRDRDQYESYKQEVLRFDSLFQKNFHEKIKIVEDLFGDKTDHISARKKLIDVLQIWEILVRDSFLKDQAIHKIKFSLDKVSVTNLYNTIVEAKQMLLQNIHPRLIIENILLNLP